jgi:hypothetical protein
MVHYDGLEVTEKIATVWYERGPMKKTLVITSPLVKRLHRYLGRLFTVSLLYPLGALIPGQ